MAGGKRVSGILFDFHNTLVPTVEADLYAFRTVKNKLLEFFVAKDAENIASKFQTLVTKISPSRHLHDTDIISSASSYGKERWIVNLTSPVIPRSQRPLKCTKYGDQRA